MLWWSLQWQPHDWSWAAPWGSGPIQSRDKCQRPQARGGVDSWAGTAQCSDCRQSRNRALAWPAERPAHELAEPSWLCERNRQAGLARVWGCQAKTKDQGPAAQAASPCSTSPWPVASTALCKAPLVLKQMTSLCGKGVDTFIYLYGTVRRSKPVYILYLY